MATAMTYHPIIPMNDITPCFRKVVKGFRDNGDYWLMLHFYQGGLRAPRIHDAGDKPKVKKTLANFLLALGKPRFTGQIAFYMKHAEFTDHFNVYPGSGSYDEHEKEGIKYRVQSSSVEDTLRFIFHFEIKGIIKKKDRIDDIRSDAASR